MYGKLKAISTAVPHKFRINVVDNAIEATTWLQRSLYVNSCAGTVDSEISTDDKKSRIFP